jgi:thioredoxin reductase
MIPSYAELEGDDFIVIGGYESGIDVAHYLAERGKRVRLFDRGQPWESESSDPSVALSTYSLERMRLSTFVEHVELFPNMTITSVTPSFHAGYEVATEDGRRFHTPVRPLLAGGFEGSHTLVSDLFELRDDGLPLLNERDESTLAPGLFLCGAAVRHDNHIFCFIYKYRQRFAVVAKAIATSLGLPADGLEAYRTWGMYLDDLSCCGEECAC